MNFNMNWGAIITTLLIKTLVIKTHVMKTLRGNLVQNETVGDNIPQ